MTRLLFFKKKTFLKVVKVLYEIFIQKLFNRTHYCLSVTLTQPNKMYSVLRDRKTFVESIKNLNYNTMYYNILQQCNFYLFRKYYEILGTMRRNYTM